MFLVSPTLLAQFLLILPVIPICIIFLLLCIADFKQQLLNWIALDSAAIILFIVWFFLQIFDKNDALILNHYKIKLELFDFLGFHYMYGLDGPSFYFIMLSAFLILICILVSWENIIYRQREFLILLFLLEALLFGVFTTGNLLIFYIFFEGGLIPMFLIIGVWGARERRIYAAQQFFFFTFLGSIFILLGIFYLFLSLGSYDYDIIIRWGWFLNPTTQILIWLLLFIGLMVKVPMIPVHTWLPEAHVEAPTAGSVLLAGILLKLGGYGFIRFLLTMLPYGTLFFIPIVQTLSFVGIIYTSCVTIRQIDLKKIIAYSSVVHMNFVVLGIFSLTTTGLCGSLLVMLSHGIISSALFICIGILYDRFGTRNIFYYGGLISKMPLFGVFFFLFTLANMGFPGTANFVGELFIILGIVFRDFIMICVALLGILLGGIYSIWLYNKIMFGNPTINNNIINFSDLSFRELIILLILVLLNFFIGFFPQTILNLIETPLWYSLDIFETIVDNLRRI